MKTRIKLEQGFGTTAIVLVIAVVALGGAVLFLGMGDNEAPSAESTRSNTSPSEQSDTVAVSNEDDMSEDSMSEDSDMMEEESDAAMQDEETVSASNETVVAEELDAAAVPDSVVASAPGTFEDYSAGKLALAADGDVVLFFHADWCPSCRSLENDINANLSSIPNNVHILKVDFDSATELKRQYGVVRQHTLVQVDASGAEIQTLTGLTNTLEQVVAQI